MPHCTVLLLPVNDIVVGRGTVGKEEVLVPEAAALEALRVVDLLIQTDDRRQVVELKSQKGELVRYQNAQFITSN